jgi:hypothetical protein
VHRSNSLVGWGSALLLLASGGTSGSRGLIAGRSAVRVVLQKARQNLVLIATHLLDCRPEVAFGATLRQGGDRLQRRQGACRGVETIGGDTTALFVGKVDDILGGMKTKRSDFSCDQRLRFRN